MPAMGAEAGPPTDGPEEQPARRLWVDLLQAAALLGAVAVAAALLAPDPHAPTAGGTITVARGPQAAEGRFVLLAGTPGQVRVTVRAAGGDAAAAPSGMLSLETETFVARGPVRCLRTSPTSAVIGVRATTLFLRTGRSEPRSGVVVLQRREGSGVATYQLDAGRSVPDCGSPSTGDLLPISGRVVITRR